MELMLLVIKVVESLTWRDEGMAISAPSKHFVNGSANGVPKALIELLDAKGHEGAPYRAQGVA